MSNTLLTPEVRARIERRFEFSQEDGNLMRAGFNQSNYAEDVVILLAEISRLEAEVNDLEEKLLDYDSENAFLTKKS